ncbi:hypothetical protein CC80DRAFT_541523 [Byssothecium circinans]|uniref:Uncharacterized protein n=1 Tax=Byssothecium circinans TaxID=147558 RepID=A0A6A5UFQ0_9PLEO|nr:hypothetical protein CC80DRAFT_541523 [Byssothecium circinans]
MSGGVIDKDGGRSRRSFPPERALWRSGAGANNYLVFFIVALVQRTVTGCTATRYRGRAREEEPGQGSPHTIVSSKHLVASTHAQSNLEQPFGTPARLAPLKLSTTRIQIRLAAKARCYGIGLDLWSCQSTINRESSRRLTYIPLFLQQQR